MRTSKLIWGVFWRSALWLLVLGTSLGGIFAMILAVPSLFGSSANWFIAITIMGLLFGGVVGLGLGLLVGIVSAVATRAYFHPLGDPRRYHRTMVLLCGGIGLFGALVAYALAFGSGSHQFIIVLVFILVPALVASASGAWTGHRVSRWYIRKSAATQPVYKLINSLQESMG